MAQKSLAESKPPLDTRTHCIFTKRSEVFSHRSQWVTSPLFKIFLATENEHKFAKKKGGIMSKVNS
jgi:hypothetical protein